MVLVSLATTACGSAPKVVTKTKIVYKKPKKVPRSDRKFNCVHKLMTDFGEITTLSQVSEACEKVYFIKR